jgi:hypothetical protein
LFSAKYKNFWKRWKKLGPWEAKKIKKDPNAIA